MRKYNFVLNLIIILAISFIMVIVQVTERKAIIALQQEIEHIQLAFNVTERTQTIKNIDTTSQISEISRQISNTTCPITAVYRYNRGPYVAMASFPGTGNTWLRYSLEQYTGILTGSMYNDSILGKELRGEGISDERVSAIKIHGYSHNEEKLFEFDPVINVSFEKAIITLRHPRDAIIADVNRRFTEPEHTSLIRRGRWRSKEVQEHMKSLLEKWSRFIVHWFLTFSGPKHIVLYENLKQDLFSEVAKVASFLELPPNLEGIECLKRDKDGKFKRRPMMWRPYISAGVEEALRIAFVRTQPILAQHNIPYTLEV